MIDIVHRLRFDAARCEVQFSKGVAGNIEEGAKEIERLRKALRELADAHYECRALAGGLEYMSARNNAVRLLQQQGKDT